jgi:hypothetical protein
LDDLHHDAEVYARRLELKAEADKRAGFESRKAAADAKAARLDAEFAKAQAKYESDRWPLEAEAAECEHWITRANTAAAELRSTCPHADVKRRHLEAITAKNATQREHDFIKGLVDSLPETIRKDSERWRHDTAGTMGHTATDEYLDKALAEAKRAGVEPRAAAIVRMESQLVQARKDLPGAEAKLAAALAEVEKAEAEFAVP